MSKKRKALGRGLGSLIPAAKPTPPPEALPPTSDGQDLARSKPRTLPIEALSPDPGQPRKHFDRARLEQLAGSIQTQGIIQPIVVSPIRDTGEYIIVAGERRWRAAQITGLHDVPVVVREANDHERLELGLVENIQRADLNPVEEARAYKHLMVLRDYTHDELADRVGKDRSTISNTLRLLKLPDKVQDLVRDGTLSMGHARALLGLATESSMLELAREIVRAKLSVRATEQAVRRKLASTGSETPEPHDEAKRRKIIVSELEDRLRRRMGVKARLKPGRGKKGAGAGAGAGAGVVELPYRDLDELDRMLRIILD